MPIISRQAGIYGLEFLIKDGTAHYTAMRDKCDAIRNMKAPKSVKNAELFAEW